MRDEQDRLIGRYFRERAEDGWLRPRLVQNPLFKQPGWSLMLEIDEGYSTTDLAVEQMEWNLARFATWGLKINAADPRGTTWLFAQVVHGPSAGRS